MNQAQIDLYQFLWAQDPNKPMDLVRLSELLKKAGM